jgi:hypothetical protein
MGFHQPRGPLRSCRRRRGQPTIRNERSDTIIAGRGAGGNNVRYRTPSNRDTHLLTALDSSQRLAQRALQIADTDLTHVVTIAPMWSSFVTTLVTTSTPSIASNASRKPRNLHDLDAAQSIHTARTWLRALWTDWSVEVRVLSGA